MTDRNDDAELQHLLDEYNPPPPLPAESLWTAIQQTAAADSATRASYRRVLRLPLPFAAAAALTLFALGIGAGAALVREPASALDSLPAVTVEHGETEQEGKLVIWF